MNDDSHDRHGRLARSRNASPDARPNVRLSEDGRPLREVLSYARRGSRFTKRQAEAWERRAGEWVKGADAVEDIEVPLDINAAWFGREAPLYVEIGSGVGETTASYAAAHPDVNVLAFEVWLPGVADTLARVEEAGSAGEPLTNVRLCTVDAAWSITELFRPGSITELWTLFPDPWHKKRHHKRRLINQPFIGTAASRLVDGGTWRLATDWADYAEHIAEAMATEPTLTGGAVARWDERPLTKFERRGLAEGREIADFAYTRTR
ncbi:tRNA (guanine(46)-N(7))-methyltransferase TrmB [Nocardioides sp. Kera G14]|uniref:tRNA (guanine(46)-N(7))-methyltransferase TrmB n=1 Tax=Nocardioides sp. Kera G14 TaxID=2884264 RepID=UPI001D11C53D|nr:tRNA (guanine(46)-N(7))-methyltransferase TrmB [Nocardioides sp. Kera G14]UDY24234.1 tRNA (guanine(46)-N(7))-methyltransferase TrmB [Nocardioides sp. Kera G14]